MLGRSGRSSRPLRPLRDRVLKRLAALDRGCGLRDARQDVSAARRGGTMFVSLQRAGRPCLRVRWIVALAMGVTVLAWPGPALGAAAVPQLEWRTCPASSPEEEEFLRPYRCSTLEVPLSYRNPAGQS